MRRVSAQAVNLGRNQHHYHHQQQSTPSHSAAATTFMLLTTSLLYVAFSLSNWQLVNDLLYFVPLGGYVGRTCDGLLISDDVRQRYFTGYRLVRHGTSRYVTVRHGTSAVRHVIDWSVTTVSCSIKDQSWDNDTASLLTKNRDTLMKRLVMQTLHALITRLTTIVVSDVNPCPCPCVSSPC